MKKIAGMVVLRVAASDLVGLRLHYPAYGFGAQKFNSVRPLLQ